MEQVGLRHIGRAPGTGLPLSPEEWQNGGKWFSYGGHAIFSRMAGSGPPLVLLHGFPTASWDWCKLWPMLTQHYQVLALDMLGFGFSDKPLNYRYSIEDQADLHEGWIAGLGLRKVRFLAHDYGANVVQELLARDQEGSLPFEIDSLCFLNSALFPEVHRPVFLQRLLAGPLGNLVCRGITRRAFDTNFRKMFGESHVPDSVELDHFWQLLTWNNGRGVLHRLIRFHEERRCQRNRWVSALLEARQPKRMIGGMADPVSGVTMAMRYRELVRSPDVVGLRGVGHYPHYESPTEVYRAVRQFHKDQ